MLRIAHISDLHFWQISYKISQIFSKRWIGNLNLILFRKNKFKLDQLYLLPNLFETLKVDYVIFSGDISSTSLKSEFELGRFFFNQIEQRGIKSFFVPGNHDNYTKKSHKQQNFYKYFTNKRANHPSILEKKYCLKKDKIEALLLKAPFLKQKWWLVGLDCSIATNIFSSTGVFSEQLEKNLKNLLDQIPKEDSIILVNHFPFIQTKSPRKCLKRHKHLRELIKKYSNIKLFLHGHTHNHKIYDLRAKQLPIVIDSGSTAHNNIGKWNLLEIEDFKCTINCFDWIKKDHFWKKTTKKTITFDHYEHK